MTTDDNAAARDDTAVLARRARLIKIGGTLASAALFAISIGVLYYMIHELDAKEVKAAFARASFSQIWMALFFHRALLSHAHRL